MVSLGHDIVTPSTHAGHVSPYLSPGKCFTVSPITLCSYLQTVLFPLPLKISKILILGTKPNPLISLFSLPPISNIRKDSAYAGNLCFFLCSLAHSLVLISITEKQNNESIYLLGTNELLMSEVNLHFPLKFLLSLSFSPRALLRRRGLEKVTVGVHSTGDLNLRASFLCCITRTSLLCLFFFLNMWRMVRVPACFVHHCILAGRHDKYILNEWSLRKIWTVSGSWGTTTLLQLHPHKCAILSFLTKTVQLAGCGTLQPLECTRPETITNNVDIMMITDSTLIPGPCLCLANF